VADEFFTDEDARRMVEEGLLEEVGAGEDGAPRFRLTALGEARAEAYVSGTVEGAEMWARLSALERGG
jgi:hypothetical protein